MNDAVAYGLTIAALGGAALAAIVLNRVAEGVGVPAPAFVLVASAVGARLIPDLHRLDPRTAGHLVGVALVVPMLSGIG